MSSVKFDDVACDTVASALESVSFMLDEINTDIESYKSSWPDATKITSRIRELSTKTRTLEDGTVETYVDYDTQTYYQNKYVNPLVSAKLNVMQTIDNITALKGNVEDIDSRVRSIQKLVEEYEEKKPATGNGGTGLKAGAAVAGGSFANTTLPPSQEGPGEAELNVDTDNDGKPDLNIDVDGDGKADLNVDTDNDGAPDVNIDRDGDGKADLNIDTDNDGAPDYNIDVDGDFVF